MGDYRVNFVRVFPTSKRATTHQIQSRHKYDPNTIIRRYICTAATTADNVQVNFVPEAPEQVVEVNDFVPSDLLVDVLREDGGSCHCGLWQFYSNTCGHHYQNYTGRCGRQRTGSGV